MALPVRIAVSAASPGEDGNDADETRHDIEDSQLLRIVPGFIASNLALGFTISTIATSQMQAMQMAQFTLLPSILLSGFIFPFYGMPIWAQ